MASGEGCTQKKTFSDAGTSGDDFGGEKDPWMGSPVAGYPHQVARGSLSLSLGLRLGCIPGIDEAGISETTTELLTNSVRHLLPPHTSPDMTALSG